MVGLVDIAPAVECVESKALPCVSMDLSKRPSRSTRPVPRAKDADDRQGRGER